MTVVASLGEGWLGSNVASPQFVESPGARRPAFRVGARRPRPIAFQSGGQVALIDNRYKLIRPGGSRKKQKVPPTTDGSMLFDLVEDPGETKDLAAERPEIVEAMKKTLIKWQASCRASAAGKDYQ